MANKAARKYGKRPPGFGLITGLALGIGTGIIIENLPIGIGVGIAMGLGFEFLNRLRK